MTGIYKSVSNTPEMEVILWVPPSLSTEDDMLRIASATALARASFDSLMQLPTLRSLTCANAIRFQRRQNRVTQVAPVVAHSQQRSCPAIAELPGTSMRQAKFTFTSILRLPFSCMTLTMPKGVSYQGRPTHLIILIQPLTSQTLDPMGRIYSIYYQSTLSQRSHARLCRSQIQC